MTFKDILKNSFLEGFRSDISTVEIVLTMIIATIVGFYIYCVYKMKTKGYCAKVQCIPCLF